MAPLSLASRPARPVATPILSAYDMQLFEILRRQRKALADEQNVPPYIILSDRTLVEMATHYPHSHEAFAALHGVGEQKLARYADLFPADSNNVLRRE